MNIPATLYSFPSPSPVCFTMSSQQVDLNRSFYTDDEFGVNLLSPLEPADEASIDFSVMTIREVEKQTGSGGPLPMFSTPTTVAVMFPELLVRFKKCKACNDQIEETRYRRHVKRCSRPKFSLPLSASNFECLPCKKKFAMRSSLSLHTTTFHVATRS